MITKTERALAEYKSGDIKGALRLAKDFRTGITKEQHKAMAMAYAAMVEPDWYPRLGKDNDTIIKAGVAVFKERFVL